MGQSAEVQIHFNLPGTAILEFATYAEALEFTKSYRNLALSATCDAIVQREPCRRLPLGADAVRLDGLSDIGGTPTALLLLRNLPASLSEAAFFQQLCDMGLNPSRILLIRSKGLLNLAAGIGYAEFASVELAGSALHSIEHNSVDAIPDLKASYVSMGAFEIAEYPYYDSFKSSGGVMLQYSNLDYFVSEYPMPNDSDSEMITSDTQELTDPEPQQATISNPLHLSSKKRKTHSDLSSSLRETLQKWQTKHSELVPPTQPTVSASATPKSYADHQRLNCYLCNRHFTSADKLNAHERVSDLHYFNLDFNPENLERANKIHAALHSATQKD